MTSQISGRTRVVGVWGHPVSHSLSPKMHNAALSVLGQDWVYVPYTVHPDRVAAAVESVRALDLVGVNVTVPLKELVLPHLDRVDEAAARIGSVNTIHNDNGVLTGYSTDGVGFISDLDRLGWPSANVTVALLGAGGSARALAYALAERGGHVVIANRTAERSEALAALVNRYFPESASVAPWGGAAGRPIDLMVNTTSLGMSPNTETAPALPESAFEGVGYVYDLIYKPAETRFLASAREAGCKTSNGLGMLVRQGAASLKIWLGSPVPSSALEAMELAVTTPA
ncbi:shikimate dehydrogenase (NADP(+)) [Capsulimonas corticalis]|uniref:Shikimate dehydrogenase (NADP(+)) n=1 Tax=Capsulimonas corticalis TaxID=2219043 RepID=A0A402CPN9_9BACT|nr:shikimate dehydrogenase [Capsulimonas corticalis]BDI32977.1 shikimate dehydrogenase (NADP(+)) [Capsulimonas corticalis]